CATCARPVPNIHAVCILRPSNLPNEFNRSSSGLPWNDNRPLLFPFARPNLDTNGDTRAEYLARQGGVQPQSIRHAPAPTFPSFRRSSRSKTGTGIAAMGHLGHRAAV